MKIPEVLENWFVRVYGNDSYLKTAREFSEEFNPDGIVGFIFDNHLERMARLKAQGEYYGKPVQPEVLMTTEEDAAMSEWLRSDMVLATLSYRKGLNEEDKETKGRVRRNIENYAPKSAKVIFEEDLKPRLGLRG